MFDINTFRSHLKEATDQHEFPVSLGKEGYIYGAKGTNPKMIKSSQPPGKVGTELADGHPHHTEILMGMLGKKK